MCALHRQPLFLDSFIFSKFILRIFYCCCFSFIALITCTDIMHWKQHIIIINNNDNEHLYSDLHCRQLNIETILLCVTLLQRERDAKRSQKNIMSEVIYQQSGDTTVYGCLLFLFRYYFSVFLLCFFYSPTFTSLF